jgi:hypothetical protein
MNESATKIAIGDSGFDLAGIGQWVSNNVSLFLLFAFVGFIFWIFQRGGFAEKYLEYRTKGKELEAKQLDDVRVLTDIFRRTYDRDDPYLPFDDETMD